MERTAGRGSDPGRVVRLSACQLAVAGTTRLVALSRLLEAFDDESEFLRPRIPRPCVETPAGCWLPVVVVAVPPPPDSCCSRSGFRAGLGGETDRESESV